MRAGEPASKGKPAGAPIEELNFWIEAAQVAEAHRAMILMDAAKLPHVKDGDQAMLEDRYRDRVADILPDERWMRNKTALSDTVKG